MSHYIGAETAIYLSLLPNDYNGPKGKFWAEGKIHEWDTTYNPLA